jgi:2-(1,2-epoxy-1,2-dihydrophenyl)acetyl-CoA isomerase
MSAKAATVGLDVADGVAHVTLDNPGALNRFEATMREDLLDALRTVAADDAVRCVRIAGAPPAFSAGADIDDMVRLRRLGDRAEVERRVVLGTAIVRTIRTMPKPVVAAVGGPAAGAGANLALACDVRLGSDRARFIESFVRIGLLPDWGGLRSLVELVGRGTAAHLMMTGEEVDATRALALGILQQVVPADGLDAHSVRYCARLARSSAPALGAIKRGIALAARGEPSGPEDPVAAHERSAQPALFATDECLAAMERFLARRLAPRESVEDAR